MTRVVKHKQSGLQPRFRLLVLIFTSLTAVALLGCDMSASPDLVANTDGPVAQSVYESEHGHEHVHCAGNDDAVRASALARGDQPNRAVLAQSTLASATPVVHAGPSSAPGEPQLAG